MLEALTEKMDFSNDRGSLCSTRRGPAAPPAGRVKNRAISLVTAHVSAGVKTVHDY